MNLIRFQSLSGGGGGISALPPISVYPSHTDVTRSVGREHKLLLFILLKYIFPSNVNFTFRANSITSVSFYSC